ncbi:hypothetical protein Tco_1362809 [Tanacetum coccineum]
MVPTSTTVHPDPNALIPYTINGEVYHLTTKQLQEQMDTEKHIKKAKEVARLLAISKPETKLVVITVYRGTDGRNFDVHRAFVFGAFGISELDELREIIPKKKNAIVHDLMNSLSQRYERIRKIPEELRIKSTLPAPTPEQASSQSSRKKRKHMELKPETRIPRVE